MTGDSACVKIDCMSFVILDLYSGEVLDESAAPSEPEIKQSESLQCPTPMLEEHAPEPDTNTTVEEIVIINSILGL